MAEKVYYTIGEVARLFQVNTSLIRFWEKEFDVIRPQKNKKGNRLFTKDDVENFRMIFHLVKEKGFTLQGARDQIRSRKKEVENEMQVIRTLSEIREFLVEMRDTLDDTEEDPDQK